MSDTAKCELCGEPMPAGEEMFKFHGYSGPCPKPPLAKPVPFPLAYVAGPFRPLVYVAGPFRGATHLDVRRNVERARDVGLLVAWCGAYPVIPHTMTADFDKQLTDDFWLQGTLELLKRCDAIMLMARWKASEGAMAEYRWAHAAGLPIFEEMNGYEVLAQWVHAWQQNRRTPTAEPPR